MKNQDQQKKTVENSEKPTPVITEIIVKTLITLAIGALVMYSGLI